MNLTEADVDVLLEALTAWKSKDNFGNFMESIMSGLVGKDDPIAKTKIEEERKLTEEKRKIEKQMREERATLLSAQLIMYKQSLCAERL